MTDTPHVSVVIDAVRRLSGDGVQVTIAGCHIWLPLSQILEADVLRAGKALSVIHVAREPAEWNGLVMTKKKLHQLRGRANNLVAKPSHSDLHALLLYAHFLNGQIVMLQAENKKLRKESTP